jgi:hypothetical protein
MPPLPIQLSTHIFPLSLMTFDFSALKSTCPPPTSSPPAFHANHFHTLGACMTTLTLGTFLTALLTSSTTSFHLFSLLRMSTITFTLVHMPLYVARPCNTHTKFYRQALTSSGGYQFPVHVVPYSLSGKISSPIATGSTRTTLLSTLPSPHLDQPLDVLVPSPISHIPMTLSVTSKSQLILFTLPIGHGHKLRDVS